MLSEITILLAREIRLDIIQHIAMIREYLSKIRNLRNTIEKLHKIEKNYVWYSIEMLIYSIILFSKIPIQSKKSITRQAKLGSLMEWPLLFPL